MIRLTLLSMFIAGICVYAWRDWYKAVCGLVLLMAVVEHPDMPKSMLGIQGLNPWNIALALIAIPWLIHRGREGLKWDMPRHIVWLLVIYFSFIVLSFTRMVFDLGGMIEWARLNYMEEPSFLSLFSEHIINCLKWVVPALLLYDGARDEARVKFGMWAVLGVYFLLALQVIRWMPFEVLSSGMELEERSLKILLSEVGYHRVNMSMLLAGAFWAVMASRAVAANKLASWGLLGAAMAIMLGQALTGGRAGYVTWGAVGFVLAVLRWRRYLLIGPVFVLIVLSIVPSARDRLMEGFTADTVDTNSQIASTMDTDGPSWYTITAGRVIAWPFVLKAIGESPIIGYGREAMQRTHIATRLWLEEGESFPHPHNAYLEFLLDNGLLGFLPVMIFYFLMVKYSMRLFRDRDSPLAVAVGGMSLSLLLALLFASMGSQTFYPREGAVGMWCAMGLMLRVYVERRTVTVSAQEESRTRNRNRNRYGGWQDPLPAR